MIRTADARVDDVRALVAAARRLSERASAIAPALVESTGLSPQGVALALREHLEVDATDEELRSLVASAGDALRVHVILSANVFVGALRAIAIAYAASTHVTVRPSQRDPWFARALVQELGSPDVRLGEDVAPLDVREGEIHVYGRDETIARVRAVARDGVRVIGHGAGMGLAWIGPDDDLAEAARALARDVAPFDQRGCLSPRVALVAGTFARASAFGACLHDALAEWETRAPRGAFSPDEAEDRARWLETMTFAGETHVAPAHGVAIATPDTSLVVPPAGRHVHIAPVSGAVAARAMIGPLLRVIVAVGANDEERARAFAPSHARLSRLGRMQRPPLDGPVDARSPR